MQPKTEEFLYLLLWSADRLARPTFRNLTDSFESWIYRNGFFHQLDKLEKRRMIERDVRAPGDRLYRLTEQGRLHALGGRDPQTAWSRPWDGQWRLVLFDLAVGQNSRRERLWRYLRGRGFGCLQGSVWVTPDPMQSELAVLAGGTVNVASLLLLEARPCAGERDGQIVAAAWDFERINRQYAQHLKVLDARPPDPLRDNAAGNALRRWAAAERQAWLEAVSLDPLLPDCLAPPDYLGREAWQRRKAALHDAGAQLRTFGP